jgi:hypothetical protein
VGRTLPKWRAGYEEWATQHALKDALRPSLFAYGTAALAFYLWSASEPQAFFAAQTLLLFNAFGLVLVSPLIGASLAGCAVFFVARASAEKKLLKDLDGSTGTPWRTLEAKWSPATDARLFFNEKPGAERNQENDHNDRAGGQDKGGAHQGRSEQKEEAKKDGGEREPPRPAPWHEVLGVKPTASPEEIKAAYREAIKAYHSDKVASLGKKLRDLAEDESKRINVAYGQARQTLAF